MRVLILDLEANWSYVKRRKRGDWAEVSDIASPFNKNNRVVCAGCYSVPSGVYTLLDFDGGAATIGDLQSIISDHDVIVGHNIKYDIHWLRTIGIDLKHMRVVDTMIREYVLRGGKEVFATLGLDKVAPIYGGTPKIDIIKDMWKAGTNTSEIPKPLLHKYLYFDVWNTYMLYKGQLNKLKEQHWAVPMDRMNLELNEVTEEMEFNGLTIDEAEAKIVLKEMEDGLAQAERNLWDIIGKRVPEDIEVNLGSPKQLSELLYSRRLIPERRDDWKAFVKGFNPRGKRARKELEEALTQCFEKTPYGFNVSPLPLYVGANGLGTGSMAIEALQETGKLSNIAQSFVDALTEVSKRHTWLESNYWSLVGNISGDGRVHGQFNQAGTQTGRYSSSNPNLQNLPAAKNTGGKNRVRQLVVSRWGKDGKILAPDFSQLELRVVMELAQCPKGIEDFKNGVDLHTSKAQWAIDYYMGDGTWESADDNQRKIWRNQQKTVNFGLIYGLQPKDDLQRAMFDAFFKDYPEVKTWNELVVAEINRYQSYRSPLTGFKYNFAGATQQNYFRGYDSKGRGWKNKALNFPVQGDAGRITQTAMIGVYRRIKEDPNIKFIGQVHDEILLDVHKNSLDKAVKICEDEMTNVGRTFKEFFNYEIKVPLATDVAVGDNFYEV